MKNMSKRLESIAINPQGRPKFSVIWLHGLGADGHDFEAVAAQLNMPTEFQVRFLFPHAPVMPVTINNGMSMRAWYDIEQADFVSQEDEVGIRRSEQQLIELIEHEINETGVAASHIILAGFSQGGAIVLHTGLRYSQTLLGVMALSTYLPLQQMFPEQAHIANQNTQILMMHGRQDSVVPLALAKKSQQLLQQLEYTVQWQVYDMPHSVIPQQIKDIRQWLVTLMLKTQGS